MMDLTLYAKSVTISALLPPQDVKSVKNLPKPMPLETPHWMRAIIWIRHGMLVTRRPEKGPRPGKHELAPGSIKPGEAKTSVLSRRDQGAVPTPISSSQEDQDNYVAGPADHSTVND